MSVACSRLTQVHCEGQTAAGELILRGELPDCCGGFAIFEVEHAIGIMQDQYGLPNCELFVSFCKPPPILVQPDGKEGKSVLMCNTHMMANRLMAQAHQSSLQFSAQTCAATNRLAMREKSPGTFQLGWPAALLRKNNPPSMRPRKMRDTCLQIGRAQQEPSEEASNYQCVFMLLLILVLRQANELFPPIFSRGEPSWQAKLPCPAGK